MPTALVALVATAALSLIAVRCRWLRARVTRRAEGPRWRSDPVPLAGGMAMVGGFAVAVVLFGRAAEGAWPVLGSAGAAFLVGLADDLRPLPPAAKLAGQAGAGLVLAAAGVRLALPGPAAVAWVATVVWVVVAANAVNLFDNVDAAAGGAALVAAAALWVWWAVGSGPAVLAAALAGAAGGFLALNLPPARLFMGDAGSHFLGAALAGLTVLDAGRAGSAGPAPVALVVLVPLVLLAVPLFDTALVAVERLRHGRPVMAGGRDHTSHRLLACGLGVLPVTAALWGAAVIAAGVASLAAAGWAWFTGGVVLLAAGLGVCGLRLARVPVYG
jgi:UDP-GlcNAc:undecaprenyl-phosphate GlcNAc-1-phosphate transferase